MSQFIEPIEEIVTQNGYKVLFDIPIGTTFVFIQYPHEGGDPGEFACVFLEDEEDKENGVYGYFRVSARYDRTDVSAETIRSEDGSEPTIMCITFQALPRRTATQTPQQPGPANQPQA